MVSRLRPFVGYGATLVGGWLSAPLAERSTKYVCAKFGILQHHDAPFGPDHPEWEAHKQRLKTQFRNCAHPPAGEQRGFMTEPAPLTHAFKEVGRYRCPGVRILAAPQGTGKSHLLSSDSSRVLIPAPALTIQVQGLEDKPWRQAFTRQLGLPDCSESYELIDEVFKELRSETKEWPCLVIDGIDHWGEAKDWEDLKGFVRRFGHNKWGEVIATTRTEELANKLEGLNGGQKIKRATDDFNEFHWTPELIHHFAYTEGQFRFDNDVKKAARIAELCKMEAELHRVTPGDVMDSLVTNATIDAEKVNFKYAGRGSQAYFIPSEPTLD